MRRIATGLTAHVDAGKTSLAEAMLYHTGIIHREGSVDKRNTVMDFDEIEKERGITIYSSMARILIDDLEVTLIDTPGHVDFSGETERALEIMDSAVLLISAPEGVQSHTRTLFDLIRRQKLPCIIFVNKMDISPFGKETIMSDIRESLSDDVVCFEFSEGRISDETAENVASLSEDAMNEFLDTGSLGNETMADLFNRGLLIPVIFGSARTGSGVDDLLEILKRFTPDERREDAFGAVCFGVSRDADDRRLSLIKITCGQINVRDEIADGDEKYKINEIRVYKGSSFEAVPSAFAGEVVAVAGLSNSYPGKGYGIESDRTSHCLTPVFRTEIVPEGQVSSHTLLEALKKEEENDSLMNVSWDRSTDGITVSLMGTVQKEVLIRKLKDKYGIDAKTLETKVSYKETVSESTEGHGHFEPLRHFADVWLAVEPLPEGSGISVTSECPVDELEEQYQNQVLRTLSGGKIKGILMNEELTDVRFVLKHGKSHNKHTSGGDFRKATEIAVRDALIHGTGKILEPYYRVRLTVPVDKMGRAMKDLERMSGDIEKPVINKEFAILEGYVPVSLIGGYHQVVTSYTGGLGSLSLEPGGYGPCHNEDEVISERGYDYRKDQDHPYKSIYVHQDIMEPDPSLDGRHTVPNGFERCVHDGPDGTYGQESIKKTPENKKYDGYGGLESDLKEIFERTYGKIERKDIGQAYEIRPADDESSSEKAREEYFRSHKRSGKKASVFKPVLIVDGYNVIHSWPDLSDTDLAASREQLLSIVSDYCGYTGEEAILVFDAYRIPDNEGSDMAFDNVRVVYTKTSETADAFIERKVHELMDRGGCSVSVVTSDGLIQSMVAGEGARRISSREFLSRVRDTSKSCQEEFKRQNGLK